MKKIKENIGKWAGKLDKRWQGLSVKKQHRCLRYFFWCYLALTVVVVAGVCFDIRKHPKTMSIEHIENPTLNQRKPAVLPQDSLMVILKKNMYGK